MDFIKGVFKVAIGIVFAIVILVVICVAAGTSKEGQEAVRENSRATMKNIYDDVAKDQVKQYEIAKQHGSKMDACVQAGFVSAAYLQAKRESDYAHWKEIESDDCKAAGVPR